MNESLFRKESLDQVSSPEDIFDYIKVSTPGIWVVLGGIIVFILAAGVWALKAEIPVTVSAKALAREDGTFICYIPYGREGNIRPGMIALVDEKPGVVESVSAVPVSREEISRSLKMEYAAYILETAEWNFAVRIKLNENSPDGGAARSPVSPSDARITTELVRPLSFLFN